jgi:large subunit ribosomal protein L19e
MVNLRIQRRLASSMLGIGRKRVWMDPNEVNEIALANSRKAVMKLIKDSFIIKKKVQMHSRQRATLRKEEKRKGRHTGLGKRRGPAGTRMPVKVLWVRRQRTLRRLLIKYREAKKIDKHLYHELYLACKASQYKSKRNLADAIEKILYQKNLEKKATTQKTVLEGKEGKKEKKEDTKKQPKEQKPKKEKEEKKEPAKKTEKKKEEKPAKKTEEKPKKEEKPKQETKKEEKGKKEEKPAKTETKQETKQPEQKKETKKETKKEGKK